MFLHQGISYQEGYVNLKINQTLSFMIYHHVFTMQLLLLHEFMWELITTA